MDPAALEPITTPIRGLTQILWIGLALAAFMAEPIGKNIQLKLPHTPIGRIATILILIYHSALYLSTGHATAMIPRASLVPILAFVDLGAVVACWAYFALLLLRSVRVEAMGRRDDKAYLFILRIFRKNGNGHAPG
jgi:hypothetical protein